MELQLQESFGLIEMQLPEKYKENLDVSREGPSVETSKFFFRLLHPYINPISVLIIGTI
jgi:hypothetical protein